MHEPGLIVRLIALAVATAVSVVVPSSLAASASASASAAKAAPAVSAVSAVSAAEAAPAAAQQVYLALKTTNASTGQLTAYGRVAPVPPNGTPVYLQRWDGRKWVGLATGRTSAGKVAIKVVRPGSVASYRLVTPARGSYRVGISATKRFAHYVWRGAFKKPITGVLGDFKVTTTDKTRRSAVAKGPRNGWVGARINTTGCTRVANWNRNRQTSTGYLEVRFWDQESVIGSATLSRPLQVGRINAALSRQRSVYFDVTDEVDPGRGFAVDVQISLLCNN